MCQPRSEFAVTNPMNKNTSSLVVAVWLLLLAAPAVPHSVAQTVPPLINYQGKLVSSNGLPVSTATTNCVSALFNAEVAKVYAAKGVQVSDFSDADLAAWRKIAEESAWKDFASKSTEAADLLKLARAID